MKNPYISFPKSVIVYHGPSRFNGRPIVVIVTGLRRKTANRKTGRMAQVWILCADMDPVTAVKTGADTAICFTCPHKGTTCYVDVGKAPQAVYRAFISGAYPTMDPAVVGAYLAERNLPVRLGAYGEPTAAPIYVLNDLTRHVDMNTGRTGYTHQWNMPNVSLYRHLLMASVDSETEALRAQAQGWRYFRTRLAHEPLLPGEFICPASDEAGHKSTCAKCRLCDGKRDDNDRRRNAVIIVHGASKKQYAKLFRRNGNTAIQVAL